MNFDEYQERAHSTAIYPDEVAEAYLALKLNGEAGELFQALIDLATLLNIKASNVSEFVAKHYRDDSGLREEMRPERKTAVIRELGDILWYVACLAYEMNVSLDYVAGENLKKLASRKERNVLHGSGSDR